MEPRTGIGLDQSLQQTIAPQMQQSLRILQAPTLELQHLVTQELEQNPVLEDVTPTESLDTGGRTDAQIDEQIANLSRLDREWREYGAQARRASPASSEDDERHRFAMDSIVSSVTLQGYAMDQLRMAVDSPDILEAAEILVGDLDERGYQRTALDQLSLELGHPLRLLKSAREVLLSLDPSGIGARDLRECLLLQLEAAGEEGGLAYRIVDAHLDELARKRHSDIARELGVHLDHVKEAAVRISELDPAPGSAYSDRPNPHVTADVVVVKEESGEWQATLTNEHVPRLRISEAYKEILAEAGRNEEVRAYLREKIRNGKFLIRSLESRQDTILRITESILRRQREFFEEGPDHLKPMVMSTLAEELDVHETTISRAVNGKFLRCPHGLFELRSFFSWGYTADDGTEVSNTSVKSVIAEIVRGEDPAKPLSDQKIVALLKEKGLPVARRTVAKYRDALGILPSHLRKEAR